MNRDREARPDQPSGLCGAFWIQVAGAESWPPPPDRQERDIHEPVQIGHLREEIGVAWKIG